MAAQIEEDLGLDLEFISAPQESAEGQRMREWIAREVRFADRDVMVRAAREMISTAGADSE
jgi:hypothetical protein